MIILMKRKIDLLKAMNTFVMVAEKGSFSEVARELNIVTSAISRQVSDIESHYDCQLLYRTTRSMHLTAEGVFYIERFKDIVSRIDELDNIAHERQQKIAGNIRISAPLGSSELGVLESTSEFVKQHPDVKVSWMFVNRFVNMVEEGIDLSIRVGELPDSNLIARKYSTVNVHFVASPQYLKQFGEPAHPNELINHQCILDSSNRLPGRWRYMENNKEQLVAVSAFIEANDGEVTARLAADGHGIALLPTFLMQSYLDKGQLVPVLKAFEFKPSPVSLVFPANKLANSTLKALINYLLENKK